ncbi:MAG TPA: hypothetical protein VGE47_00235 [Burkholderiaceae bacterium]
MNLRQIWNDLRSQWQASARLRMLVAAIGAILLVFALTLAMDAVDAQRERLKTLDADLARLQDLARDRSWPEHAKEADQLNAALATMAWAEADIGLSEAALNDWLRNVPARLGLKTRELTVARVEESRADPRAPSLAASAAQPAVPPGHQVLRAHLSFEFQRGPLMSFLAEIARSERSVVVERLVLRGSTQPQIAELDLRVLARKSDAREVKP